MKTGKPRKRADGRWESQIVVGTYDDGRPKRKSFYGHTSREAAAKRDKWLKENTVNTMDNAKYYEGTESFSKFADSWLEIKKATVREYTYENTYRTRVEKYLKPYFGDKPMNLITHRDIQIFFVNHINLSMGLQKTLRTILRDMFEQAMMDDLCRKNPTNGVKLKSTYKEKEKKILNEEQRRKAIEWSIENKRFWDIRILR